jgi:ribonuclease BN (tRNA processing enzyme)
LRVIFCGTSAGSPYPDRACAGIVLDNDGRLVMLDCGHGSVREAQRCGLDLRDIEGVFISHLHQDHAVDLAELMSVFRRTPKKMAPVFGPPLTPILTAAATAYIEVMPFSGRTELPDTVVIQPGDEREACGYEVRSEETPHDPNVRAFVRRFEARGKTVVYSGDTSPNPDTFVPLSERVDLLIHEAFSDAALDRYVLRRPPETRETFVRRHNERHSEVRRVAAIARDAGVRRLALTHLLPTEDAEDLRKQASAIYPGELIIARDGLVLEI